MNNAPHAHTFIIETQGQIRQMLKRWNTFCAVFFMAKEDKNSREYGENGQLELVTQVSETNVSVSKTNKSTCAAEYVFDSKMHQRKMKRSKW